MLAGPAAGRTAIDVACGAGVETHALLEAQWRVYAFDADPVAPEVVYARTRYVPNARMAVEWKRFTDLVTLPAAHLVYAGYALPYVPPGDFDRVWSLVRSALQPGGVFAGNLFGDRDSWVGDSGLTFLSATAARTLFDGMDVLRFDETEGDGPGFSGDKHWHTYDVIARMPA